MLRHEQKTFPSFIKAPEKGQAGEQKKTQGRERTKNNIGGQGANTERRRTKKKGKPTNKQTEKQIQREEGPEKKQRKKKQRKQIDTERGRAS